MIKKIFLGLLGLILLFVAFLFIHLRNDYSPLSPAVSYLNQMPEIDGVLDEDLKNLIPQRDYDYSFNINFLKGSMGSNYRMAYNSNYLYLYLEAETDSLIMRDRGYQNGDGFVLLLSTVKPENEKTDEFYVLGFSAQERKDRLWAKKVIWYHNVDTELKRLGNEVKIEAQAYEGKIGFELLLPWSQVYPYHPMLGKQIGFNLMFVKAIENRSMPNTQGVIFDLMLFAENSLRKYKIMDFEQPQFDQPPEAFTSFNQNHFYQEETINVSHSFLSEGGVDSLNFKVFSSDKNLVFDSKYLIEHNNGFDKKEFKIETAELEAGNYQFIWESQKAKVSDSLNFTILPQFDKGSMNKRLVAIQSKIAEGSYNTLLFHVNELDKRIQKLKNFDDCEELLTDLNEAIEKLEISENGIDTLKTKPLIQRRAFLSDLDSTLQPYKIRVPENYDPAQEYPLLVFLHGSGRNEKSMFSHHHSYVNSDAYIQIAPRARGTSNYYATDAAQIDIQEAIADAIINYNIDESRIILGGFSMGGYGVYRTYWENPEMFSALAIFSGMPKLEFFRKLFLKGDIPSFLKEKNLKAFNDIPIFIYHGKEDINCPYSLTKEFVEKLEEAGATVEFHTDEKLGHSHSPELIKKYFEWVDEIIK